tara:strand:- start:522 stop:1613 length:1092 start_codon:yes stop_codon:yes gene_type:complete
MKLISKAAISISTLLLSFTFFENLIESKPLFAKDFELKEKISNPSYKLGPGDRLEIKLFQMESFNKVLNVLPDGTISLPRIGTLYVEGYTLKDTNLLITNKYKNILKRPIVYINLIQARPVRITISGEVQKPGIYSLDLSNDSELQNYSGGISNRVSSKGWPTIIEAIQKAGGLTSQANLRNIILKRKINKNLEETIDINLWKPLKNGSSIFNQYIYDGDSILVQKSNKLRADELHIISRSNFTPATISVNVIGEVIKPGIQTLRSNVPLTEALLSAGGLTAKSNKNGIKHFRLKENGTIQSKIIKYDPTTKINEINNPVLLDRDIIMVPKNSLAKTTDAFRTILEPARPVVDSISIYRLFNN